MSLLVTEQRGTAATLPQTPGRKRRPKPSQIKYGLFFFMLFMMITAVKVYLNYANINQNIIDVKAKIIQRQKDMQYLEIQNAYYTSEYAAKLTAHQQGILLPGEQFILFERINPVDPLLVTGGSMAGTSGGASTGGALRPIDARRDFFQKKIDLIP